MSLLHTSGPYRRGGSGHLRVPAVLPLVQMRIDDDGWVDITIDSIGYATDPASRREDLHRVLEEITRDLALPVKLEIYEPDGSVFTDIITPSPRNTAHDESQASSVVQKSVSTSPGEVAGDGFLPDEKVAIAVIVGHQTAEADGTARLRLPPALLAGRPGCVVLVGCSSGAIALNDAVVSAAGGVG